MFGLKPAAPLFFLKRVGLCMRVDGNVPDSWQDEVIFKARV